MHDNIAVWKQPWFDSGAIANNQPKESYYAVYGDLLCIDKDKNRYLFSKNADFEYLKDKGYYPIAMVYTRGNFNVYGDCSISCVSLNWLSKTTPNGTIYDDDEATIPFYDVYGDINKVIRVQHGIYIDDPQVNEKNGYCSQPIIPSNYWKPEEADTVQALNGEFYYLKNGIANNESTEREYSPCFYLESEEMNPLWWFSDINDFTQQCNIRGKDDTQFWIDNYLSFNEDGTINENSKWKCCQPIRYALEYNPKDSNTKGEWYVPATGELGIFAHKIGTYNELINKLRRTFGTDVGVHYLKQSVYASRFSGVSQEGVKNLGGLSIALSRQVGTTAYPIKAMIRFENTKNKVRINIEWNDYMKSILLNNRRYYHFNEHEYILMPKGEVLKWSIEINPIYETTDELEGEFVVENECTLGIFNAERANSNLIVGDIILANKEDGSLCSIESQDINEEIAEEYEPIGIVVIPTNHDVYGTQEVGVIGLRTVSVKTPEIGSVESQEMIYMSNLDTIDATKYPTLPINNDPKKNNVNSTTSNSGEVKVGSTRNGFKTATSHPKEFADSSGNTLLTPYLPDDSRNPNFYANSNWGTSQFNGKEETQRLAELYGETVTPIYYVQKYKTLGTNEGDWYIWAFGEMIYFVDRQQEVYDAMNTVMEYWPDFKYNFCFKNDGSNGTYNGALCITFRDTASGKDRPYRADLNIATVKDEGSMYLNSRFWFPFTRLKHVKPISL